MHFAFCIFLLLPPRPASAYIEIPFPLGRIVNEATNIVLLRVESVDKEKNLIVYRKVRDVKGTHKGDTIKHNIGRGGFHPREWQNVMAWAEVGQAALFFHNGGAGEVCISNYWYQVYAGDWWALSHAEPFMLRTYYGKPERLATYVASMLTGQEVVVPCMVDGDKNALHLRTARVQRLKASLKIQDYNATRDFAGWGVEEFRPVGDMPAFTHITSLPKVSPNAAGCQAADFDADGRMDVCLFGQAKVSVLQNGGGSLNETPLPADGGIAAWADYNGDGRPDLLIASPGRLKLFMNTAKGFTDVSAALPRENYSNISAAAWIDYDGDGRADILLADGFRGLRLLRNKTADPAAAPPPAKIAGLGPWRYIGPFDNANNAGFDGVFPPEKGVDLKMTYPGKNGEQAVWRDGDFRDGQVNNLAIFKPENNENSLVYLYRELDLGTAPVELPVSLGSDDSLKAWLNGRPVHAENVARPCEPDQVRLTLKLRPGRNALLLKVCQGSGGFAFYFRADQPGAVARAPLQFEEVSDKAGLGSAGLAADLRGDHLAVADVNGDGRADLLYSAGGGILAINTGGGFAAAKNSGIVYRPGGVAPAFGDFDGDGRADLFVPQAGGSRLFRNLGDGRFADVTASAGALAGLNCEATCAVWTKLGAVAGPGDRPAGERPDLLIGCLRGPNRYLRNNGDGTFADATSQLGLEYRIFNTRGLSVLDVNRDGTPDVVFVNEGQESAALLGNPTFKLARNGK